MNEIRDLSLVKKIKKRDERALLEVIEIYTPLIKTIVNAKLYFLKEEKDEVINDVFLKIWENIDQFDMSRGSFRNWICGIANFHSIDTLRRVYEKEDNLPLDEDIVATDYSPEDNILKEETYNQLLEFLESLKPKDKEIFLDLFFKGYTYEEVSKKYGIDISNLYNRVSRSRKVLKNLYGEELK